FRSSDTTALRARSDRCAHECTAARERRSVIRPAGWLETALGGHNRRASHRRSAPKSDLEEHDRAGPIGRPGKHKTRWATHRRRPSLVNTRAWRYNRSFNSFGSSNSWPASSCPAESKPNAAAPALPPCLASEGSDSEPGRAFSAAARLAGLPDTFFLFFFFLGFCRALARLLPPGVPGSPGTPRIPASGMPPLFAIFCIILRASKKRATS